MKYLLQRLGFYAITLWAAVTINFLLPRLTPGDPVMSLINRFQGQISTTAIDSLYKLFGLDKTKGLWAQYVDYWGEMFKGNLGTSFTFFPTPVETVIGQALPWTIALVGITTLISFALGTGIGAYAGWKRGSWIDAVIPATTFLSSVPFFWLGMFFISVFTGPDSLLPPSNGYEPGLVPHWDTTFIGSAVLHSILPALTILVTSVSGWILGMRNMTVAVSQEDYITVAHAKGLKEGRVMWRYAARNALLPNVSGFALALGFIVGGTLLVELVFSYPGLGYLLYQSIGSHDYPLTQGIFFIITLAVLVANFLADVVYVLLDPRTRREG